MLWLLRYALWGVTRLVLSLRYRLRVHGLDKVRQIQGSLLILPNHPGLNDPLLVLAGIWPALKPRPMLYEGNFRGLLYPVMGLLNAVRVPSLEQASMNARDRARQAVAGVIEGLHKGENHILWPSGNLQTDGTERLGGARTLADVLQEAPGATVVLVRTRGVFGSMFSYAPTGKHPSLRRCLLAGAGWLLANLLLFAPRRRVDVHLEIIDSAALPERRREVLNPWFEARYNAGGPEKPTFVPYHLLGKRTFQFPEIHLKGAVDLSKVPPETREAVAQIVADKVGRSLSEEEQQAETTFDQLGLDSLDRMEMALRVEQQFGFSGDEVPATLGQLWALAAGQAERAPVKPPPEKWFRPPSDTGPLQIHGETLAEAFVARALAARRDVAVADDLAGVLTYEELLVGALTMARRFGPLPAPNVGLMLPASAASDIAFLGLHLAGKLPVLLNWTTGPANLAHAARTMGLTHVVTSQAFVDRSGVAVEGTQYLFLEELRKGIGKGEQLRALLAVRFLPQGKLRARLPRQGADEPAVVLFTSGSEKAPKAVPLTHRNLLSNQRSGVAFFGLARHDSLLGFLPAFHSFGMSVTGLMPLLGGMRVVRHPDPTDARGLVRKVAGYRPTLLAGTPTFVSYLLDRAEPGQLDSLRLIIVGAEKCPEALRERCGRLAPRALLLEGYGITECAPVVSANGPRAHKPGTLGLPLPGVEVRVVDLETEEPLPPGRLGMLWVSGPNVFPGYLGHEGESPFRQRDGKRWYVTGDLATIDAEGFIHFGGRLKRFLKAGGEMISLPALEEPFVKLYPPTEEGHRVAVDGVETEGGRRIALFTTEPITLAEANRLLEQEGFRGVMRLTEVLRVEKIPQLGSGKVDYKALKKLLSG